MLNAPDGSPTNAVYGFLRILQKLEADEAPDGVFVAFDRPEPTFRHEMTATYKATRTGMPDDLAAQLPVLKEVLDALGAVRAESPGYEADDLLGTAARLASESGAEAVVVTGDRDSLQLVTDSVRVLLVRTAKGVTETKSYTPEVFAEEYGFEPPRLVDLKALMGDSSDNIKGVAGVGEKTAKDLISRFGSLDRVYENLPDVKESVRRKLEAGRGDAYLSYRLASIITDAPLEFDAAAAAKRADTPKLRELYSRLGFTKLLAQLGEADAEEQMSLFETLKFELPDGADASVIGLNVKDELRRGEDLGREFDVALAAYVVNPTARTYDLDSLCRRYLGREAGESERAAALFMLRETLDAQLEESGCRELFYGVEMPLCRTLADMERAGILIDQNALNAYGAMLDARINSSRETVYALAGEDFNVNSPKQLGEILFDKLGLPAPKKTKTGYSTSADILDKLKYEYPIVSAVLEYRELAKLRATYVDGLLKVVAPDGRVRTTFQMTATATGRLSSTEPNLQNIPIRRELGEKLRYMFVSEPGKLLIDADYSQIELRLLAHIAGDSSMTEAFRTGEDIHAVTAARVFGTELSEVTPAMRSRAKAVNFGIVYGESAFSLSKSINTSVAEARDYMDSYFDRFSGVRAYMADIVEKAKRDGYVATLFGRRRYIPQLRASDYNTRAFGERVALNMPIQGTAADIMKIATVRAYAALREAAPEARLLLQVHDELICEAPEAVAGTARTVLAREMENAATLDVPLLVESASGKSWGECH
jgi:DNA polymerase-1